MSLIQAIRNICAGRDHNIEIATVIAAGKTELIRAGIEPVGQIVIPENRAVIAKNNPAIGNDVLNLTGKIYQSPILSKIGCRIMSGLVSDITVPVYSRTDATPLGETDPAVPSDGTFSSKSLTPHRISGSVNISREFLLQDSTGSEEFIKKTIIDSIHRKIECLLFGNSYNAEYNQQGLFYNYPSTAEVEAYRDFLAKEVEILSNNVSPRYYIASPIAYSFFRKFERERGVIGGLQTAMNNDGSFTTVNFVSGIPVIISNNVYSSPSAGGYVVGDFSNLIIAQWGNIDLAVDPYTYSVYGYVSLVANVYFDYCFPVDCEYLIGVCKEAPPTPTS